MTGASGLPLRARWLTRETRTQRVTWLELFFDLVFVAAVAQVATPLHHHYDLAGVGRFAVLFVLIWWAWVGHATFATRFDVADTAQRLLTILQMFVVAVMAANATDTLASDESAGFAAGYAVLRLILVSQYYRARHVAGAEALVRRHMWGHGAAAVLWLASAFVPAPARFVLWAAAFAIDLGTPWLTLRHAVAAPPDAEHLPERFGLFTIILLGESVIAVMHGIQSQDGWSVPAASAALLGMTAAFTVWWAYFEKVKAAAERHVRCAQDALRYHVWLFVHLPFYVGLIVSAVAVQRSIEAEPGTLLPVGELVLLGGGALLAVVSLGGLAWCGAPRAVAQARRVVADRLLSPQ